MSFYERDNERRVALFISPHLDDVAFSCGGMLAQLAREGWTVILTTIFTRSVAEPRGFALGCQLDKGLPPDADYMKIRRAEDREFARRIVVPGSAGENAVEVVHLDHAEAPHRGYEDAASLFGEVHEEDEISGEISGDIASLIFSRSSDLILAPQGLGGHVDHLQTIKALRSATAQLESSRIPRTLWFRDAPYAIRRPDEQSSRLLPDATEETAFLLSSDDLEAKLHACAAYATQLGFQFGGTEKMRESLTDFATEERRRVGLTDGSYAEVFLIKPPVKPEKGTA